MGDTPVARAHCSLVVPLDVSFVKIFNCLNGPVEETQLKVAVARRFRLEIVLIHLWRRRQQQQQQASEPDVEANASTREHNHGY